MTMSPARSVLCTSTPWSSRGSGSTSTRTPATAEALQLRAARDPAGPSQGQASPGGTDRGVLLRRQSRHGVVVRQAGAARHRPRHRHRMAPKPKTREGWAKLMQSARRQGRPHRRTRHPARQEPEADERVRQHLVGRRLRLGRPAAGRTRLGHARKMDAGQRPHPQEGLPAAIYLLQPGANTRVRTWCPTPGAAVRLPRHPQRIDLDRRLLHGARRRQCESTGRPATTPIIPANDAVLSLHEMFGRKAASSRTHHILDENEIVDGIDELGVLLYGHAKNAYWYGSQLSIEETRAALPPTRMPPACRCRRRCSPAWCGPWRTRRPASSRPTRWTSRALPRSAEAVSRPGEAVTTPTGPRWKDAPASSPRTSIPPTPGPSATFWCAEPSYNFSRHERPGEHDSGFFFT